MDEEFDDAKYSSIYEMRICATVKGMKNSGYSLEKCLEYLNEVENLCNITTKDRIKEFYSDEFSL